MTIEQICNAALQNQDKAVVLSDHTTMYGTMEFLRACRKHDLKPIIGLEIDMQRGLQRHPLLLIARNAKGLQDLFALSTRLSFETPSVLPLEELDVYAKDLIVLPAGGDLVLEQLCHDEQIDDVVEFFEDISEKVPVFYASIALNDSPRYRVSNRILRMAAQAAGLKTAAISRVEYLEPEGAEIQRLLQAIDKGTLFQDPDLQVRQGRYWRTQEEMEALYTPQELAAVDEIVSMVEGYDLPRACLPVYPNKAGVESNAYLRSLCAAGLKKRFEGKSVPQVYLERLEQELSVILPMGFADYFLIVWDFIREARQRSILVGPGRGSAAGSLVSWVLGISHMDPVANGLLFERFLNPERISMPDIDTDFPDDRRDEIISYVQERYGKGHAAHIVTFARFKARLAVRDSAKALGVRDREIDPLIRRMPSGSAVTLAQCMDNSPGFRAMVESSRELGRVMAFALKIEGLPRHASIHAGGIVLARNPILQQAPLAPLGGELPAVQFSMDYLEELGLIKFDFLALRNLTTLQQMNDQVARIAGRPLALFSLPWQDPKVYAMLRKGLTLGIFQLESAGIRDLILRFQPNRFEDIAAILALYRPGPMKNIDLYLQARQGKKVQSLHPLLDGILAETGGIFLYQEQIMEAARVIGGFTLAQADSLRKAMSKKKRDVMESWKERFVQGALQRKIEEKTALEIFEVMERFADYGFNKSHSYAYGMLVFQMAYIKAHFPLAFYQCSLNAILGSKEKTSQFIAEAGRNGLKVLPVSLNASFDAYVPEKGMLRMPFSLISGISVQAARQIVEERNLRGPFTEPMMTAGRLSEAGLSRAQIRTLMASGVFDDLGLNRETLLHNFDLIMTFTGMLSKDEQTGRLAFESVSLPKLESQPVNMSQRLLDEKEAYGFFISPHPAAALRRRYPDLLSTQALQTRKGFVKVAGMLLGMKEIKTRKGQLMAFGTLQDDFGETELAIMPELYEKLRIDSPVGQMVVIHGKKDQRKSILVRDLFRVDGN